LSQAFFQQVLQNMHTQIHDIKTAKPLFLIEIFVHFAIGLRTFKIP
jgi:hypothetical protein